MAVGGYRVFDCKSANFVSGSYVTVHGIHAAIESLGKKPIILQNFSLGGSETSAMWINFRQTGTSYIGLIGTNTGGMLVGITVGQNDSVQMFVTQQSANPSVSGEDGPSASM